MRYAAYGSNLHPLRLSERVSSATLIGTSHIPNWSLRFHKRSLDKSGKCNIVSGGRGIYVAIFDLSLADKAVLDEIEGLGFGYAGFSLRVPSFGECEFYMADAPYIDDFLVPYDWYRELVLLGARNHGFPKSYVNEIESVATRRDPDRHRSAKRWATVNAIKAAA